MPPPQGPRSRPKRHCHKAKPPRSVAEEPAQGNNQPIRPHREVLRELNQPGRGTTGRQASHKENRPPVRTPTNTQKNLERRPKARCTFGPRKPSSLVQASSSPPIPSSNTAEIDELLWEIDAVRLQDESPLSVQQALLSQADILQARRGKRQVQVAEGDPAPPHGGSEPFIFPNESSSWGP